MFNKSLFRFAQGKHYKEKSMPLKSAGVPTGLCAGVAASHDFIAAQYGSSGSVVICPMDFSEFKRNDNPPVISAHPTLCDLKFSPWEPNLLVTGGEEGTVKLWEVPKGGLTENLSVPKAKIEVKGAVRNFQFHPSASNVLAVGTKQGIDVLDLATGVIKYSFSVPGFSKDTQSVNWNADGSQLVAIGKNSALHLFDPRAAAQDQLGSFTTLDTKKPQNAFFMKDNLAVLAQDNQQKPYFAWYDPRDLSKPTFKKSLNLSPGLLLPFYDPDTNMLMLTLRGATLIPTFDVSEPKPGKGAAFADATQMMTDDPIKGACMIPKSACDSDKHEVQRIVSLTANSIEQMGIIVARKNPGFAEELFPDTVDNTPAISETDYFDGKNGVVKKVGVQTLARKLNGGAVATPVATPAAAKAVAKTDEKKEAPKPAERRVSISKAPTIVDKPKPKQPETFKYEATNVRSKLDAKLHTSLFKHLDGKEPREARDTWYKVNVEAQCYLAKNLKCNSKFYGVCTKMGRGSTLSVMDLTKKGRAPEMPLCLRAHKFPITAFDLGLCNSNLVVTADQQGKVLAWSIPDGGLTADLTEPIAEFTAKGKVTVCQLSPVVDGLMATGSTGPDGHTLQVWDIKNKSEECCIEGFHGDAILDVQFDFWAQLLATSSKDGMVRVLDIRTRDTIAEFTVVECMKDTQLVWVARDLLLVYGTGKQSRRSLSMWNIRTKECLFTYVHDMNGAAYQSHYDRDMQVLFTANNGGTSMDMWKISTQAPYIELLNTYKSPSMFQGSCFMPKLGSVTVKDVVVAQSFKLSGDKIIPITWTIPRKRKEFFQDDLFEPTWDLKPVCTSTEWFGGNFPEGTEVNRVNLKPDDMINLSEAPKEELTVREQRYQAHNLKKTEPKKKGILGHESAEEVAAHFTEVAKEMPKQNRFDAAYDETSKDVDEDEWD